MKLKFCGFRQLADVKKAKDLDIDAMGFIHFPKSKRFVDIQTIKQFTDIIPEDKEKVVILVNPEYKVIDSLIEETGITSIQLHGEETLSTISYIRQKNKDIKIIKALPAKDSASLLTAIEYYKYVIDQFIIDTPSQNYGGTGKVYDWKMLEVIRDIDYLIAGGINYENIQKIAQLSLQHSGYDIASGIETNNVKDKCKMESIIELVKGAN
ncbi:phosphoribosylanthranilate isomerase [Staphylococcus pseudoxylosus]|uniref:phosphoribosylanthranilate isomerase n=1 Tax=Staphylococcus pseudoxylosus TaxID=2282419 RepID=UPI000D1ED794|nr:phosphoribosylanthranilate isomerase [Staphylococcus pseudoxylosus]PTI55894.1 phosphoribosylanthranilate isomerase [Staphylococcus xylosus]MEB6045035.1 phosphoribosylanthranilate isomerase [Staphylococcus pseudoxylosus]MEB6060006.1 phosphoribosylanthranilate isomerase [Staphylococcus pseudoxylosus]MEB7752749.1 phosphoribosylanthranilate isomerase [Staphylococcus pseudoxylosus]MEB8007914.1 phosphoribosylanthranilate isomerase [Staphylococcus pseudoxylosus]